MDFDPDLLLNFVPVIAASGLTFVTCLTVLLKLKSRWPVTVNCWFCNRNSKLPRQLLDWWLCSHCKQYNGFSKDGDYNYEIPEQCRVASGNSASHPSYCQKKTFFQTENQLCDKCNQREQFKLLKLRELESSMDQCSDKKIRRFEQSFQIKYPLCLKCQSIVQNVLYRQKLWLAEYKMLLFKQKPIGRIIKNREKIERILRVLLFALALVTTFFTQTWYLPLCGILFQLAACIACPINRGQSDVFPILGWICLICSKAFSITTILKILQINFNNHWANVDDSNYRYFVITLAIAIGVSNLKFKYYKTISYGSLSLKKLQPRNKNIFKSDTFLSELETSHNKETVQDEKSNRHLYSPVNITDTLMTATSVEMPIPLKPANFINTSERSFSENKTLPIDNFYSKISSSSDAESFSRSFTKESNCLNDSVTSLNSLTLGTDEKVSPSNSSGRVFETRVYGTTSPDLFTRNMRYNNQQKRSILAPAKLRSVTQTSWVAGGYWQSGMTADMLQTTLSRSSSQSSGIGSLYGPPSREPSLRDELDRCSVASEQCCFAQPDSPLISGRNSCVSKRITMSPRCSNSSMSDVACCTESLQYHVRNETQCKGHATTIVTNSIWVPALLCGSLVFNVVIFCTILLR